MDTIKELIETFNNRLKSRIVSSILISFTVINWKPIFYLVFEPVSSLEKFEYFDAHTSFFSLFILPLIIGLIVSVAMPWVSYAGLLFSSMPDALYKKATNNSQNVDAMDKLQHQQNFEKFKANRERALIDAAKRDEEVKEIKNLEIRDRLEKEIEDSRDIETIGTEVNLHEVLFPNGVIQSENEAPFSLEEFRIIIKDINSEIEILERDLEENISEREVIESRIKGTELMFHNKIQELQNSREDEKVLLERVERVEVLDGLNDEKWLADEKVNQKISEMENLKIKKLSFVKEFEHYYE